MISRQKIRLALAVLAHFSFASWVTACSESTRPAVREPVKGPLLEIEPVTIDSGWNYYAADVRMSFSGDNGFTVSNERVTEYHLLRTLDEDGIWTNETAFDAYRPFAGTPAPSEPHEIAKVVSKDDGSAATYYGRDGGMVPIQPDEEIFDYAQGYAGGHPGIDTIRPFPQLVGGDGRVDIVAGASMALPNGAPSTQPVRDPRAWLDNIVVSPTARVRNIARIQAHLGLPTMKLDGRDRYVRSAHGKTIEVLVDPTIGSVTEVNVADNGKLVSHTVHQFARMGAEGYLKVGTLHEDERFGRHVTINTSYRNIRVARRVK